MIASAVELKERMRHGGQLLRVMGRSGGFWLINSGPRERVKARTARAIVREFDRETAGRTPAGFVRYIYTLPPV